MPYELVVIGASAGGLQAVGRVLAALPHGFGLPIAVAQHRSSSSGEGDLPVMWQRDTALTVCEAEDKAPIVPGTVYVAPADYHLLVEARGQFALSTEAPVLWARPSIDLLFETASEAYGGGVIGVILSGASHDGSRGLDAIRRRGGCALVQKPSTAECDVMPSAAIAATAVNHVLELGELGRVLPGRALRGNSMNRVRILLVDDHAENLLALEAILQPTGHALVRANSGREALKAVLRDEFALILMDVAMPGLDGYETVELIRGRERSKHTPIIFLTANFKSDAHVFRGYSVGAVDYLFKPFVPDVLLSKVAVFVELYNKGQDMKDASEALKRAYSDVERRIEERTEELAEVNRSLKGEMAERQRVELERLRLLESEQRARLEAQRMNRLKDEFLATLSHELRTPLNAILGWARILEVGPRDAGKVERAMRAIKNNAQAQAQLVADILDVSRIIGGNLPLDLAPASIVAVIDAALEAVQPAADAKSIRITTEIEKIAPILADRDRLQQVMWNLLSNAIKFTPKDGRVHVAAQALSRDIVITVADSGQGIDPSFLPHVFERFTQEDGSMARQHGGLGLGMAIVRHLVELHGGTVSAASAGRNQGAVFTVSLPVTVRPAAESEPQFERRGSRHRHGDVVAGDVESQDGVPFRP